MELLDAVKQWEVCMNQPTKIHGCLIEDCPLHENVIIKGDGLIERIAGDTVTGEFTFKLEGCLLMGKIKDLCSKNQKRIDRRKGNGIQVY